jgi:hypothetical protein
VAVVHVPQNEAAPVIRELLAAAERLGLPASVVATASDGLFGFSLIVPDAVYDMAGQIRIEQAYGPGGPLERTKEPEPKPKNKGGRPRKVAAEPVVEEEE